MLQADPDEPQCGFEVVEAPAVVPHDPCVPGPDVQTVLGPTTVIRGHGTPVTQTIPLVASTGWLCIKVDNQGTKGNIGLDGHVVISEDQLAHPLREVQGVTHATGGGHTLSVRLTGTPGRSATITVTHHPSDVQDPPFHPVTGSQGLITAANLWADPPRVTPANQNGVDDEAIIRATVSVGHWPGSLSAHEVSLRYEVQIWRADSCDLVNTLSGSLPVDGKGIVLGLAAAWDGRDQIGDWARSGTYYYSIHLRLERTHNADTVLLDALQTQVQALTVVNNDGWDRVSLVNMDDWDRKIDLLCVRTEGDLSTVTVQALEGGTLRSETTYGPGDAYIVKDAGNYIETCFSDVPAPAQAGPDSGLEMVVFIAPSGMPPLDPVVENPPAPTVGTFVDVHFSPRLFTWNINRVPVGETIRVWTQGTDIGNPVLYLHDDYLHRVVDQDDDNGPGGYPEGEINYTVQQSGGFDFTVLTIYVLPSDSWSTGETTMCYEYADVSFCRTQSFGGHYVEMGKHGSERVHTAWLPGGPECVYAVLMQRIPSLNPLEPKADFVVHGDISAGKASYPGLVMLEAPPDDHPLRFLFVAPTCDAQTEELDRVRVLSNDVAMTPSADVPDRDPDGDGVGYLLERFIGTCDSAAQVVHVDPSPPGGYPCSRVKNLQDTDGDGLSDYWEIFGVPASDVQGHEPNEAFGVPLTLYGADPRHKDMFVELDAYAKWNPDGCLSRNPDDPACYRAYHFSHSTIADLVPFFSDGTWEELNNPDGRSGLSLHFDIGPEEAPGCGPGSTLCGDWGGSALDIRDDVTNPDPPILPELFEARLAGLTKRRWGIFRHGWCGDSNPGTAGEAFEETFRSRGCGWSRTTVHEIGHTLGLGHGGYNQVLCKPHYVSLMNYQYEHDAGFSHGERLFLPGTPHPFFLNPLRVCEGLGIGARGGWNIDEHREALQDDYQTLLLPGAADYLGAIDWNHDGQIEAGSDSAYCHLFGTGAVSAPVLSHCKDYDSYIHSDEDRLPSSAQGPGTPKLLRKPNGELALFYQDPQGRIVERRHPDDYNACRDVTPHDCGDWSAPKVVFEHEPGDNIDFARFDAVRAGFGVLFVFATSDGHLVTQRALEVPSSIPGETEWSLESAEDIPSAVIKATFRPVIKVMSGMRFVFFWGSDNLLWQATRSGPAGTWTIEHVLVEDEQEPHPVQRTIPIAVALPIDPSAAVGRPPADPVSSERLYMVVKTSLGATPPPGESWTDVLYPMEHISGRVWRAPGFVPIRLPKYNPPPLNNMDTPQTLAPRHNVALAYVPNDHSIPAFHGDVDLTKGGRLYLAFGFLQSTTQNRDPVSIALSRDDDFLTWTGQWQSYSMTGWLPSWTGLSETELRDGISMHVDPGYDANPRIAAKVAAEDLGPIAVHISPFPDGIRDLFLYDHNDWWAIRDGLCRRLVEKRCSTNDCHQVPTVIDTLCGPMGPYLPGFPVPSLLGGGSACENLEQ